MPDKLFLDVAFSIQVQMEVDGRGLDVVMAQMILDIRDGVPGIKHINSPGVAETVNRINCPKPFGRKGHGKIFFTDSIDPMPGQLCPPLVDK